MIIASLSAASRANRTEPAAASPPAGAASGDHAFARELEAVGSHTDDRAAPRSGPQDSAMTLGMVPRAGGAPALAEQRSEAALDEEARELSGQDVEVATHLADAPSTHATAPPSSSAPTAAPLNGSSLRNMPDAIGHESTNAAISSPLAAASPEGGAARRSATVVPSAPLPRLGDAVRDTHEPVDGPLRAAGATAIRTETHLLAAQPAASTARAPAAAVGADHKLSARADDAIIAAAMPDPSTAGDEPVSEGSSGGHIAQITDQITGPIARAVMSFDAPATVRPPTPPVPVAGSAAAAAMTSGAGDVVRTLKFDLHPGDLGSVSVRLTLGGSELRLHLSFSTARTADLARADQQQLLAALTESGMSVSGLVIDAGAAIRSEPTSRLPAGEGAYSSGYGASSSGGGGADRHHGGQPHTDRHRHQQEPPRRDPSPERADARRGVFV